jgi:chromosome partitioning protein
MLVLAVLAQKGGVGKSMLARSLAVQALIDGKKAVVLDADPQGTVLAWSRRRQAQVPSVFPLGGQTITALLAEIEHRGGEVVLIDTPPHAQPIINMAAEAATAALLITGPYPEDLEQVAPIVGIVQALGKPAGIILNKTPTRSQALAAARAALATFRLPTALTHLLGHPYASAEGLTAQERESEGKPAAELAAVWAWIKDSILP